MRCRNFLLIFPKYFRETAFVKFQVCSLFFSWMWYNIYRILYNIEKFEFIGAVCRSEHWYSTQGFASPAVIARWKEPISSKAASPTCYKVRQSRTYMQVAKRHCCRTSFFPPCIPPTPWLAQFYYTELYMRSESVQPRQVGVSGAGGTAFECNTAPTA